MYLLVRRDPALATRCGASLHAAEQARHRADEMHKHRRSRACRSTLCVTAPGAAPNGERPATETPHAVEQTRIL